MNPGADFPWVYMIVLNWNSYNDTTACIESLEALDYPHFKIVIVDNASRDGSESILRSRFPHYPFIQTGKNLGYAGGNNYGIRYALRAGAKYVWILNPDVTVEKESLKTMVEVMESDLSVGLSGPRVIWKLPDRTVCTDGFSICPERGFLDKSNLIEDYREIPTDSLPSVKETQGVCGCSILVRSQVFFDVGLIREDFFMYYEELEFSLRVRNRGWKAVICPRVKNWHIPKRDGARLKLVSYLGPRNAILLARVQKKYLWQTLASILSLRWCLSSLRRGRLGDLHRHLAGVLVGLVKPLRPVPRLQD